MQNQRKSSDLALPPDEQRCTRTNGSKWRCKNILSSDYDPSYYCDYHYTSSWYYRNHLKETTNSKKQKCRKLTDILNSLADEVHDDKRQRAETVENPDDQLRNCSSKEVGLVQLEETQEECDITLEKILGLCKTKCSELLVELEKKTMDGIQGKLDELESMKIATEKVLEKLKNRVELKEMGKDMESERRKEQDEVEFWRNKFNDLEARVLRMVSNVDPLLEWSQILENDTPPDNNGEKENDGAEFSGGRHHVSNEDEVDTHRQVEVEVAEVGNTNAVVKSGDVIYLEARVLRMESINNGEKENGASEFSGGRHCVSNEDEVDTHRQVEDEVARVGNTSAAVNSPDVIYIDSDDDSVVELESSKNRDGENVGKWLLEDANSKIPLGGDVMDKLGMKCRNNRNKEEGMQWESEADMLSSFGKDPELCVKAVCALYRQPTFKEKSANGVFHDWIKNLAETLMEGDLKGDLKKSVEEFVAKSTNAVLEVCKRLASCYSEQLFGIYKDKQDPFFLPTSTVSSSC